MKTVLLAIQRRLRLGESRVKSALKEIDALAAKLEAADTTLAKEIALETDAIEAERERLAVREAAAQSALQRLNAERQRTRRIADRVFNFTA